jgi:hypothetical protein
MASKSWQEKLSDNKGFPQICPIDETRHKRWGTGTFVIPAPLEVAAIMDKVPKGKLITIDAIRKQLARKHRTTIACPITTGIFAWIAAHAAAEAARDGKKRTTAYWRTLKTKGEINAKYPGGIVELSRRLKDEGHRVIRKGKRFFVQDYEKRLMV